MVQRAKSVGKLGIQADHVKSEKLSSSLKPSGSLYQDGKAKGADYFKRKIKKSRSISLDGLNPSSPRRKMSSSPPDVDTPLRKSQPWVKARHGLPNYMKSTNSSDARKENSQVTRLQSIPAVTVAKVSRRRCSTGKYSPESAARNLRRSSSLKLSRALTKAPSFKPARSTSAEKCTQGVVCADSSIQKATCSSTLKETKYPEYIMLNPGGTEAEGTSVFKVCPYSYCSLNGHRHAQLPPLKRFVAARRRLLKAQKSAKVVPLSPDGFCLGDKPACVRLELEAEFFVEIYAESEKEESLKIERVVRGSEVEVIEFCEKGEDDGCSSPSDEGTCRYGLTGGMAAYNDDGDDGLKGVIDRDKTVENCRDATEMVAGDLDEVYSLIMTQKGSPFSHCEVYGDDLLESAEDHDDSTDDGWDEEDCSSSELGEDESLSMTETEDGRDKDTLEYEEDKKEEENEPDVCSPGLQEDCMSSCRTPDALNETVKVAEVAEIEGLADERDGDTDIGAQTLSTGLILQTQVDEAGTGTSEKVDVFSPKGSLDTSEGLGEEIIVTEEPLTYTESIIVEEFGLQDEEEMRACEQASNDGTLTQLRISDTSLEDSCESDRSLAMLGFARGQENDETSLLMSDNLEGFSTGKLHHSEDHLEQSEKVDVNNAAEPSTSWSVLDETTLMSTESKDMYFRRQGKSHEELSGSSMIWRINRREKYDVPDEEMWRFNPRDPNYLPIVPDPDGEKIDLRHQMIDDRRNSEEWMIDHALQQAVSKLSPARNNKVELLVKAFEKVMPVSQFETGAKSSSTEIPCS